MSIFAGRHSKRTTRSMSQTPSCFASLDGLLPDMFVFDINSICDEITRELFVSGLSGLRAIHREAALYQEQKTLGYRHELNALRAKYHLPPL